jgi:hypothetical protein
MKSVQKRIAGMLSMLGGFIAVYLVIPMTASAAPHANCEIAAHIKPLADRLSGDAMGLAYVVGIPLAVLAVVGVIIFAGSSRSGGLLKTGGIAIGGLLILGVIGAVLVTVVHPAC